MENTWKDGKFPDDPKFVRRVVGLKFFITFLILLTSKQSSIFLFYKIYDHIFSWGLLVRSKFHRSAYSTDSRTFANDKSRSFVIFVAFFADAYILPMVFMWPISLRKESYEGPYTIGLPCSAEGLPSCVHTTATGKCKMLSWKP